MRFAMFSPVMGRRSTGMGIDLVIRTTEPSWTEPEPVGATMRGPTDLVPDPAREGAVAAVVVVVVLLPLVRAAPAAVTGQGSATLFRSGIEHVVMFRVGGSSERVFPLGLDQEGDVAILIRPCDVSLFGESARSLAGHLKSKNSFIGDSEGGSAHDFEAALALPGAGTARRVSFSWV